MGEGSVGAQWDRTIYDAMAYVYDVGRAMPEQWVTEWLKERDLPDDLPSFFISGRRLLLS